MKFTKSNIIFENNQFYILVKPQDIPIQRDGKSTHSLAQALEDYLEFGLGIEDPFIGLVHRLDRHTGGLCVFAKTPKALNHLNQIFSTRKVSKCYLAIVKGTPPKSQRLSHYLTVDQRANYVSAHDQEVPQSKHAVLTYDVIDQIDSEFGPLSLIQVQLQTGRQHQIRVQLAHIGFPVLGDPKYGTCDLEGESLALWAYSLKFQSYQYTALPIMPLCSNRYFELFKETFARLGSLEIEH